MGQKGVEATVHTNLKKQQINMATESEEGKKLYNNNVPELLRVAMTIL